MTGSSQSPIAYRAAVATIRPFMRAVANHEWSGEEHLPPKGTGFVVCANHTSHIDPLAVADFLFHTGRTPQFLAKAGLLETPIIGPWLKACGQIAVYRGSERAVEAYVDAVDAVRNGACIVVMPESTLTRDPLLWPMQGKTGAARIALTTGAPVIPVGQWGAHELIPPYGRPDPWPRKTLRVRAGAPVDLSAWQGKSDDVHALHEATEAIMTAITQELEVLRGETAPPGRWDRNLNTRHEVEL